MEEDEVKVEMDVDVDVDVEEDSVEEEDDDEESDRVRLEGLLVMVMARLIVLKRKCIIVRNFEIGVVPDRAGGVPI